jgi:serine/threonine-protein kinase
MDETAHLEAGRVIAGRYRVERLIGEGGMGCVYLVRHVHTDEGLALKLVHAHVLKDASAVERFRREARTPAKIASEHVARVTDADTAPDLGDAPFYVMEYLRGRDLERILIEDGAIPPALVVEYLRQTARALDKAHAIGIVHRDLKPENLFLTHREDGSPCIKLLDFGIARIADADVAANMRTQAGFVFGTPGFMAPEQMVGEVDKIGPAADVWALGLVAYRLLVAKDFWQAQTPAHLCAMVLSEPIPTPTARESPFGPAFDAWFSRCVARNIDDRFKSAGEAVAALADALGVRLEMKSNASLVAANEILSERLLAAARASFPSNPNPPASTRGVGAVAAAPPAAPVDPAFAPPADAQSLRMDPALSRPASARGRLIAVVGLLIGAFVGAAIVVALVVKKPRAEGLVASATASVASPEAGAEEAGITGSWAEPAATHAASMTSAEAARPKGVATTTGGGSAGSTAGGFQGGRTTGSPTRDPSAKEERSKENREQRKRLEALQRMCDQGTFTPAECHAKRAAIMRGEH